MKLNRNQKKTFVIALLFVTVMFLIWLGFGAEVFTKTQVLMEKHDELFGNSYKEWKDQFVLGLDYTLVAIGLIFIASSVIAWRQRKLRD
jgi:hypothetical protein